MKKELTMNLNDEGIEFVKRHGMTVLNDSKRALKHNKVNVKFFEYSDDFNMINSEKLSYETEPLLTVEIAQSELERLASFENRVFNNMAKKGHFNLFETLMEQKEEERYLKEKYPAVKKAYEQYSLMLKLAKSGEIDN